MVGETRDEEAPLAATVAFADPHSASSGLWLPPDGAVGETALADGAAAVVVVVVTAVFLLLLLLPPPVADLAIDFMKERMARTVALAT